MKYLPYLKFGTLNFEEAFSKIGRVTLTSLRVSFQIGTAVSGACGLNSTTRAYKNITCLTDIMPDFEAVILKF